MKISRAVAAGFEVWYQSRISVITAAGFLSAASARILIGSVDWPSVLIVALCTAAAYWSDDCFDFSRDQRRFPSRIHTRIRTAKLAATFCAVIAVLMLLRRSQFRLAELLLLLGVLTGGFCYLSSRLSEEVRGSRPWILFRTVCVSFVWSATTVLAPILNRGMPIRFDVRASIAFIWTLMLVVCALWAEGEHPDRHARRRPTPAYDRSLLLGCLFGAFLVLAGLWKGYFPWLNVALLATCAWNALFVLFRHRFQHTDRRVLNEIMILMNIFGCLLVIGAYSHLEVVPGPATAQDWFQLLALAVFYGNVAVKLSALKVKDDSGDYLDLLLVLGLAILGFQILLSALHLEQWLVPALQLRLFHARAASIAGAVLTGIALLLQTWAYISMAGAWRLMAKSEGAPRLITSGLYAFTRNPIYVSAEMYIAGAFLMNGSIVFALFLLLAPLLIHLQIRREEVFLLQHCSAEYEPYLESTPRYIGL